jgi:hypothetical protein
MTVPSELLRQRPDILAADAALKVAAAQEALATAEMFPSCPSAPPSASPVSAGPRPRWRRCGDWRLADAAAVPRRRPALAREAAKEAYLAAEANYRQTVLNAFQNVADSLVALSQDADALQAAAAARVRNRAGAMRASVRNWGPTRPAPSAPASASISMPGWARSRHRQPHERYRDAVPGHGASPKGAGAKCPALQ